MTKRRIFLVFFAAFCLAILIYYLWISYPYPPAIGIFEDAQRFVTQNIIGIVSILVAIFVPLSGSVYNSKRKTRAIYETACKASNSLKPYEVLGIRGQSRFGFDRFYYQRDEDNTIERMIEANENVLVVGSPLAGKSRAIYQAITNLRKHYNVTIPRLVDINPERFIVPRSLRLRRKRILILDDLDKFVRKQHFQLLISEFLKKGAVIVASCRIGPEYEQALIEIESAFSLFDHPVNIGKISREAAERVAEKTGKELPDRFDGNIGSIFLQLDAVKIRYRDCTDVEKGVLRSIKRLYFAGIFKERELFDLERIKLVSEQKEGIKKQQYEWTELFKDLAKKGLVEIIGTEARAEESYLKHVFENDLHIRGNFHDMMSVFHNDPQALSYIGLNASTIGGAELFVARAA